MSIHVCFQLCKKLSPWMVCLIGIAIIAILHSPLKIWAEPPVLAKWEKKTLDSDHMGKSNLVLYIHWEAHKAMIHAWGDWKALDMASQIKPKVMPILDGYLKAFFFQLDRKIAEKSGWACPSVGPSVRIAGRHLLFQPNPNDQTPEAWACMYWKDHGGKAHLFVLWTLHRESSDIRDEFDEGDFRSWIQHTVKKDL